MLLPGFTADKSLAKPLSVDSRMLQKPARSKGEMRTYYVRASALRRQNCNSTWVTLLLEQICKSLTGISGFA